MKKRQVEEGCYKSVCEKCLNSVATKGLLGKNYRCSAGKKARQNSCFYFRCLGKDSPVCERCRSYYLYKE